MKDDEQIVIENAHDAIIDTKTFAYAQEQLKLRSKSNYRGEKKYATDYSGFLFCGDCGSPMFSMSRPDLAAAYTCGAYHRRGLKGCTSHHIRVDLLDGLLKDYLISVRDNCQHMIAELEQMIQSQPHREEELGRTVENIEVQINDAKNQLKELYKQKVLIALGESDAKSKIKEQIFDEMESELTERIAGLETQFSQAVNIRNTLIETNRKAKTVIDVFEDILRKEKLDKRDIGLIIDRIIVYEDHLLVKLKADVDTLLALEGTEGIINFPQGSKDILKKTVVQSTSNRPDKVFTVNVISDGDPLEIFTTRDGEVIFKKYSLIGGLEDFAAQFCDTLAHSSDFTAAITDRDSVIATAGPGKRELIGHNLSPEMEQLMEGRSVYQRAKDDEALPVCEGSTRLVALTAAPILCQGDVLGLVLFAAEKGQLPGESEYKLAQTVAAFLGRHMEA